MDDFVLPHIAAEALGTDRTSLGRWRRAGKLTKDVHYKETIHGAMFSISAIRPLLEPAPPTKPAMRLKATA